MAPSPSDPSTREVPVKTELRYAAACAVLSAVPAFAVHATEGDARPSNPQNRMAACAHEAKGLKGEERERFLSRCLKTHGAEAGPVKEAHHDAAGHSQQNRMKSCNEQAGKKALHGDERRTFMSTCLKG
jgi:hypothetical protein